MTHIDWLVLEANEDAAEEQLDRPYAWLDGRIYTRREYDKLRDEAGEKLGNAVYCAHRIEEYDKELFFENIDTILEKKNRIYEDNALGLTRTVNFSFMWDFEFAGERPLHFEVGAMLGIWENGDWRKPCPKCGELGYQYKVHYPKAECYCPHCKEFFTAAADSEDRSRAFAVCNYIYPEGWLKRKQEETEELAQGLSSLHETESKESDTETELSDSAEKLAFEKAKEHGKMIANYKIAISDANTFLKSEFTTPVEKFLKLLKEDREITAFEMASGEIEKLYMIMRQM